MTLPIFDGHNDTLLRRYLPGSPARPFFQRSDIGHFDLPRAWAGGMFGGLFAVFVPDPDDTLGSVHRTRDELYRPTRAIDASYAGAVVGKGVDELVGLASRSQGRFKIQTDADAILANREAGVFSAVLHFEGAEPIAADLHNLEGYYAQGLRSVGLVWSRENTFATGVQFECPGTPNVGPGLTPAGRELVQAFNRLGIMLDLSHLNERGFWDVEQLSDAPLVATHSCVHALCPSSRNLTDKQLDAIAASGGVVGINYAVALFRPDGDLIADTPLDMLAAHFRYVADRIGVDHVAMGSDFDGAQVPADLKDVAGLPRLVDALKKAGFNAAELEKIAWQNWLRVLKQTWK